MLLCLLNYLTSFGVTGTSSNTNSSIWQTGHDTLYYQSVTGSSNYFTAYNRVKVIQGDGSVDSLDWVVFNFTQDSNGDFDGYHTSSGYFGGENTSSGGSFNLPQPVDGFIFGHTGSRWELLYRLPLGVSNSVANHTNGNWFNPGGVVAYGYSRATE